MIQFITRLRTHFIVLHPTFISLKLGIGLNKLLFPFGLDTNGVLDNVDNI